MYYQLRLQTQECAAYATWKLIIHIYVILLSVAICTYIYEQIATDSKIYLTYAFKIMCEHTACTAEILCHLQKSEKRAAISGFFGLRISWKEQLRRLSGKLSFPIKWCLISFPVTPPYWILKWPAKMSRSWGWAGSRGIRRWPSKQQTVASGQETFNWIVNHC